MVSFHKNVKSPFPKIDKEDGTRSGSPSVSPASSVSDMSSSSEQMLRILTSISVTETRTLSSSYIIIPNISNSSMLAKVKKNVNVPSDLVVTKLSFNAPLTKEIAALRENSKSVPLRPGRVGA